MSIYFYKTMKLTNFTDYSIRVLIYLASIENKIATAKEISQYFNISINHIIKVVHNLSMNDYIITKKGNNGGITLKIKASEIRIGDVVRKIEPNFYIVECFNSSKNKCIITHSCKIKNIFKNAEMAFLSELDKYTLADITLDLALINLNPI